MFIKIYLHDLIIRICAYFSARLQGRYKQKVTVAPVALQVHTIVNVCMQKLWSKISCPAKFQHLVSTVLSFARPSIVLGKSEGILKLKSSGSNVIELEQNNHYSLEKKLNLDMIQTAMTATQILTLTLPIVMTTIQLTTHEFHCTLVLHYSLKYIMYAYNAVRNTFLMTVKL